MAKYYLMLRMKIFKNVIFADRKDNLNRIETDAGGGG